MKKLERIKLSVLSNDITVLGEKECAGIKGGIEVKDFDHMSSAEQLELLQGIYASRMGDLADYMDMDAINWKYDHTGNAYYEGSTSVDGRDVSFVFYNGSAYGASDANKMCVWDREVGLDTNNDGRVEHNDIIRNTTGNALASIHYGD